MPKEASVKTKYVVDLTKEERDLDGSQPHAWRYLVEAENDSSADVADQR
jgi:hypothetical protein